MVLAFSAFGSWAVVFPKGLCALQPFLSVLKVAKPQS